MPSEQQLTGATRAEPESGDALAKKLGIRTEGMPLAILWEPEGFGERLGLPNGEYETDLILGKHELILIFTGSRVVLKEFFPLAIARLEPAGCIWIATPQKTSEMKTDLTANEVLAIAESFDMIETKRATIDGEWNAIKFRKGTKQSSVTLERVAPYSISMFSIPIASDGERPGA
ncbi:MAG TPA: hypothetical protein VGM92_07545 [Candidatus Kapabacteria bacterium]|jgi:hypothetical protein